MRIQERQNRLQVKVIALLGVALLVLVSPRIDAQVVVDIPDANLEAAIRETLGIPTDPLTNVDMASLTLFSAPEKGITDLSGLEYCVNLTNLYLGDNDISDISPLSGLTNLMTLDIYENNIANISPLTGLIKLESLWLDSNNITDITTLAGLTNLRSLDLSSNNISDFSPLLALTNLSFLLLNNSNINDISLFAGMTNLTGLRLNDNNITDIGPLGSLTNLNYLELSDNNISDLSPVADLTNLIMLFMGGNNISDIGPISVLTNLTQLGLGNNISDISPLSGLTNLEVLLLTTNNISDISPLAGLTNLGALGLQRNDISDISVLAGLTNLLVLGISSNNISDFSPLASMTNLTQLSLETTNISDISVLAGLTNLTYLELDDNNINNISVIAGFANLNYLELNLNNISDISPLSDLMNMTYLDLEDNPLECDAYLTVIPSIIEYNPDIEIYYDPMPPDCEFVNQPPEAVDDVFSTHTNMQLTMDVLANDWDPDEDELIMVGVTTQPEHGDLVLNPDDTFAYTPEEGFAGEDSFSYEISDGLLSATATVTIMVTNLSPVANDDLVTTLRDTYVEFNIFVNDSDPDGDLYTITSMGSPSNGTLSWWNPDGQCAYIPNESFVGEDSFVYEISDGWLSDSATVTISVTESYSPEDQIEEILDFVDVAVEVGTLTGDGLGNSGDNRLNALTNMLEEAQSLIEAELYEEALEQVESVYKHVDGESPPKDFAKGEAAANVAAMIANLMESILDVM
jgi:internalin A